MGGKVDRSAMRIASSPTLRIAAGLLLAVLLSVVGYQVVRRLNSHGPEALLKRADEMSWLVRAVQTKPSYLSTEQRVHLRSMAPYIMAASAPIDAVIRGSVPSPSHDSIVDLLLAPVLVWHQSTLSRRPVSSQ
jgi:hypothetical protein